MSTIEIVRTCLGRPKCGSTTAHFGESYIVRLSVTRCGLINDVRPVYINHDSKLLKLIQSVEAVEKMLPADLKGRDLNEMPREGGWT